MRLALLVALLAAALPAPARADGRELELGVGTAFDALGAYDVGAHLGLPAEGDDLGPATLGFVVLGGIVVAPAATVTLDAGLAIGGLVRTDERYFGGRSEVGSTLRVWARVGGAWEVARRGNLGLRVGAAVAVERLSEATGSGFVHLDAVAVGPTVCLAVGPGLRLELRADVHLPWAAEIQGQASGAPAGSFLSAGAQLAYLWGL